MCLCMCVLFVRMHVGICIYESVLSECNTVLSIEGLFIHLISSVDKRVPVLGFTGPYSGPSIAVSPHGAKWTHLCLLIDFALGTWDSEFLVQMTPNPLTEAVQVLACVCGAAHSRPEGMDIGNRGRLGRPGLRSGCRMLGSPRILHRT